MSRQNLHLLWQRRRQALAEAVDIKPRQTVLASAVLAAAVALVTSTPPPLALTGVAVLMVVLLGVGLFLRRCRLFLLLSLAVCSLACYADWRVRSNAAATGALIGGRPLQLSGQVESCQPSNLAGQHRLRVRVGQFGILMLTVPDAALPAALLSADQDAERFSIKFRGRVLAPDAARFPWEFDQRAYFFKLGITAQAHLLKHSVVQEIGRGPPAAVSQAGHRIDELRAAMVRLHRQALGLERGDLLASMVIGDKAVSPSVRIRKQFRMLGLSHIVAASGFNLTIVVAVMWALIRLLTRSTVVGSLCCFAAVVCFCLLAGFSASVERAALMCSILLIVSCLRRSVYLPASVCLALIISLIIEPRCLLDAGWQLSYAATLAIALSVRRLTDLAAKAGGLPGWLVDATVVVLLANAAVLPLQMIYFWQLGALSLPANIVVAPLVAPITVLGFVSSSLAAAGCPWLWLPALAIDVVAGWFLQLMMLAVDLFSSCRWSLLDVGPPLPATVALYYAALGYLQLALPARQTAAGNWRRLLVAFALFVLAFAGLFVRPCLRNITILQVPHGMLVIGVDRQAVIFGDAGSRPMQKALLFFRVRSLLYVPLEFKPVLPRFRQSQLLQLDEQARCLRAVDCVQQIYECSN